ncbi:MCE family protein [Nocardia sp. NPDC050697]|uniref:MCE family protein n=1 Tax=Nocardia sp. NPDC050697 TaxID=3155158 RepID=UPI0033FA3135
MRTRRQWWGNPSSFGPRTIGVLALATLTVVLLAALGVNNLGPGQRSYEFEFAQAAGLSVGDRVTVAGVGVGTVTEQRLAGDHVLVTARIEDSVRVGAETKAAIKLTTLLGARYLELSPAGDGSPPDDRITLSHTSVPYDLQQALENAATTFDQVDAAQIGRSLDTLATQLDGLPAVLPEVLANVRSLAQLLGDRRAELGSLLAGVRELTTVLRQQQDDLATVATVGRDLLRDIVARRDALTGLITATTRLVEQVRGLVVNDRAGIDELVRGLEGLLGSLARHQDLLRSILEILPVPVRNLTNASGTGNDVDFTAPAGVLVDSWMCALSGRANGLNLPPYFGDCR